MSLYVLDTDTLSLWQLKDPVVCQRVKAHPPKDVMITVISIEEMLSGWYSRLRRARRRDELARVYQRLTDAVQSLSGLQILSFTEPAMLRYDQLRAMKLNVGKKDLCIAAIVLEFGGTLVTRNLRDFQRVPNLPLEDWTV
jgi:tRNA(fMet)-specific endonuclease VapC